MSTPRPQYRSWTIDDIPGIQNVLFKTWVATYGEFIPMHDMQWYFNNYYSELHFKHMIDDPHIWNYVAEVNGAIVGYGRAKINKEEKRFYMESLYILPEFQGKGIGAELLRMCEKHAVSNNFKEVWLGVMEQNRSSLDWYKKLGFQFTSELPFQMGKTTVNHLIGFRTIT